MREILVSKTRPIPFYVRLRREISWLLGLKVLALLVIYFSFFSPAHKTKITPDKLNSHLLNLSSSKPAGKQHKLNTQHRITQPDQAREKT